MAPSRRGMQERTVGASPAPGLGCKELALALRPPVRLLLRFRGAIWLPALLLLVGSTARALCLESVVQLDLIRIHIECLNA
jgi:hypothetical protein